MKTIKITHDFPDYWYDKTIPSYLKNCRQKLKLDTEVKMYPDNKYEFVSDMVILFYENGKPSKDFMQGSNKINYGF